MIWVMRVMRVMRVLRVVSVADTFGYVESSGIISVIRVLRVGLLG